MLYENVFILRPDLSQEQIDQTIERIEDIIKKGGSEVSNLERWGKKRLAYKVDKERYGYYVLMHFDGKPDLVKELERNYGHFDEVIKYITIAIKKGEPVKIEMDAEEFLEEEKAPLEEAVEETENGAVEEEEKVEGAEQAEETVEVEGMAEEAEGEKEGEAEAEEEALQEEDN
jgi:small subunit ribosomal protein S6